MNFRLTIALVIVMLGMAMVFVGIRSHQQNTPKEDPLTKNALLSPQPKDVKAISFTQDGQQQVAFAKTGTDWSLTYPVSAPANTYDVANIADTLKSLNFKEKYEPETNGVHSPENTGTDKPKNVVAFTDDANKEHTLGLGKTTVGGIYATLDGGKTIYLLSTNPLDSLDKDPQSFRNKTIKETPVEKITGLSIKHADQTVTLAKSADKWMIDAPISSRANATAVEDILNEMKNIHASAFVDFAKDMPATGLRTPVATVTALVEDKPAPTTAASQPAAVKTPVTIELGYYTDLTDKKNVYASMAGSKEVFTISADTFNKLNRELKDLRDPAITPLPLSDATNISITTDGKTTQVAKQNGNWTLTLSPPPTPAATLPADATSVTDLLSNLRNLRAIKFVDNAGNLKSIGLDPPTTRVELTLPGQSQHEVILIGKPENADTVTPMMRQGEPTVYLVQTPEVDKLALSPIALRDRTIERLTAANIRTISIAGADAAAGGVTLDRDGTSWKITQSGKTVKPDDARVAALLGDFTPLTAAKYLGEGETVSGLPNVKVIVTATESTTPPATAPSTSPATLPAAIGPSPSRTITRTLRLFKVAGTWRALWDGGNPQWTFEPSPSLVDHLTNGTYAATETPPAK